MIRYIEGDLFDSCAQVLVNTVNTAGVMGKGIALQFKKRYPNTFELYKAQCEKHNLTIGKLMLCYEKEHWILNFPTKENWRNPSRIEYIEKGLMTFRRKYTDYSISSIAFPKLGCGNGGLQWNEVKPLMERYLGDLGIEVYVYVNNLSTEYDEKNNSANENIFKKRNQKDLTFSALKREIASLNSLSAIPFDGDLKGWNAKIRNNTLIFETFENEIVLDEDELHRLWDEIRIKKVFPVSCDLSEKLFEYFLFTIGYLHRIRIVDENNDDVLDGFQLNICFDENDSKEVLL